MRIDDRFDDLIEGLAGFHRTWLIYLGVELGLFEALRAADPDGMTAPGLAEATGCATSPIEAWLWAADTHALVTIDGDRATVDPAIAVILLDETRPEYLGGQFVHAVVASLDWDEMSSFFRTGRPMLQRPDRYRASIERLTLQDVAVFFAEGLAALPQLVADLSTGGRVVDIHCGGGRWLIAMARRFPEIELVGIESQPDSVARARASIAAAGLTDRITVEETDAASVSSPGGYDLAYYQYALHQLADPAASLGVAWSALRPGGRLLVLDWPLPSDQEEARTRHGELIAGVQLDELLQGSALVTRERFAGWFEAGGLPHPVVIELPSGASMFLVERKR